MRVRELIKAFLLVSLMVLSNETEDGVLKKNKSNAKDKLSGWKIFFVNLKEHHHENHFHHLSNIYSSKARLFSNAQLNIFRVGAILKKFWRCSTL